MIIKRIKNKKHELKKFQENLLALKQSNITPRQLPYLVRQWRLWLQVTRNFAMIEGSWIKGFKTYMSIFKGFPQPNNRAINKPPPQTDRSL